MKNTLKTVLRLFLGILSVIVAAVLITVFFSKVLNVMHAMALQWVSLLISFVGFYVAGLINRKTKLAFILFLFIAFIIFVPLKQMHFPFFFVIILFASIGLLASRKGLSAKYKIPSLLLLGVVFGFYLFSQPLIIKNKGFGYSVNNDLFNATVLWDFSDSIPSSLPNETFRDVNDSKVSLQSFEGKKMYVTFWATWCGPCLSEKPELERLKESFSNDTNIVFVDISIDSDMQRWKNHLLKEKPMGVQLISNNEDLTRSNFEFSGIPFHVVANSEGYTKEHSGASFLDRSLLANSDSLTEYINTPYMVFKTEVVDGQQTIKRVR